MNHQFKQSRRWLLILLSLALTSCAIGQPKYFFHSFNFDTFSDGKDSRHPEIDVLDYEYGSSGQFGTRTTKENREYRAARNGFGQWGITGMMQRGEYLYVKWRIKATGEILEDRVDLTKRLPANMTNRDLHFAIYGSQLYVYLFPPFRTDDGIVIPGSPPGPEHGKRGSQPLLDIPYAQKYQIYPDIKK